MTMLPDRLKFAGITATWRHPNDHKTAVLASTYPRILAGYPKVRDIAPNTAILW